jgi:transposase
MPGRKPPEIHLTDSERQSLELLVRRYSTGQQKAIRGRIILLAADSKNNREIVKELEVSVDTARLWRQRWLDLHSISLDDLTVEERLEDLPRSGTPPRLTANQICQIEELACEKPENSGRPITHWTGREIADEIKKRGIVDEISPRHASRLLKKKASNRT